MSQPDGVTFVYEIVVRDFVGTEAVRSRPFRCRPSPEGDLIGCVRLRGWPTGECDDPIGTRSGNSVHIEAPAVFGGTTWDLTLREDGQTMTGIQTTHCSDPWCGSQEVTVGRYLPASGHRRMSD